MNPPKKERKPKYFHPSDIFSIVPTDQFCRSWRDGSGRVVMQDSESHDRHPRQRGHREPIAAFLAYSPQPTTLQ